MNDKGIKSKKYNCLNCGKVLPFKWYHCKHKYCDAKCQQEHIYQTITLKKFERGEIHDRKSLSRVLKRERGIACEKCSLTQWLDQPIKLEIDHINGNPSDNLPSNLRLICPNCHSMTDSWKGLNRGFGRKSRNLPIN
jgi:hypothetical protein